MKEADSAEEEKGDLWVGLVYAGGGGVSGWSVLVEYIEC